MTIETFWALRKGERTPELLTAWDEFTIDQNPQGWEDDKRRGAEAIGDDAAGFRSITLVVLASDIADAFTPPRVRADVLNDPLD